MNIDETSRDDVVFFELRGRLTVETEDEFNAALERWLHAGRPRLVLNLAHIAYIDSCGLGAIARAYVSARRHGGGLKLLNVSGRNHHLMTVTKLLTVIETYDSEEAAKRSFDRYRTVC